MLYPNKLPMDLMPLLSVNPMSTPSFEDIGGGT